MVTPSQPLMARFADQFRTPRVPLPLSLSVDFDASSAAQSATRPVLRSGFGTAVPLEHCSVYWAGMAGGVGGVGAAGGAGGVGGAGATGAGGTARSAALNAVASPAPVISNETAIMDSVATSASAAMGLGDLRREDGFRRDESRRRSDEAAPPLPRVDEGRAGVISLEHMTGGGILSIGADDCGELLHELSSRLSRKAISVWC